MVTPSGHLWDEWGENMDSIRKLLDDFYEGVEGEAYEILMHQVAPKPSGAVILLVETETLEPIRFIQVVYIDIKKDWQPVTIIESHGFLAENYELVRNICKAVFSAVVSRLYNGWD